MRIEHICLCVRASSVVFVQSFVPNDTGFGYTIMCVITDGRDITRQFLSAVSLKSGYTKSSQ